MKISEWNSRMLLLKFGFQQKEIYDEYGNLTLEPQIVNNIANGELLVILISIKQEMERGLSRISYNPIYIILEYITIKKKFLININEIIFS